MLKHFLDLLFPPTSLKGETGEWVTDSEFRELKGWPVRIEKLQLEPRGVTSIDRLVAADTYARSPMLRTAVHRFKYQRIPSLGPVLGSLLLEAAALIAPHRDTVLCPVPLHWTRQFYRGFNQSLFLAESVAKATGWPVIDLLRRRRPTGQQALRTREERWSSLDNAFVLRKTNEQVPPSVILIDDITTSGATLEHCARVLRSVGVEHVQALVLAQG